MGADRAGNGASPAGSGRSDPFSLTAARAAPAAETAAPPALNLLDAAAASAPAANAAGPALVRIATVVGDPGFGPAVSHQLVTLAKTGAQSAELSLNPEHFGPVTVSIQMNGLEASVSISAGHEATRTALREALPHLGELFAQNGLQLGGAHVGDGSERNGERQAQADKRPATPFMPGNGAVRPGAAPAAGGLPSATVGSRLVDTFA
jgi:flagellar hook-length control protein FliK